MRRGGEEVVDVDGRRGGKEHNGRKEGGAPAHEPLLIFDQCFARGLIKTTATTMLDEILSCCSDAV
jgi:hypothetical protein